MPSYIKKIGFFAKKVLTNSRYGDIICESKKWI